MEKHQIFFHFGNPKKKRFMLFTVLSKNLRTFLMKENILNKKINIFCGKHLAFI